ncbi:MAG: TMEM165/GDT1 family protein [Candidatus Omnitrophica bacterium]|nr:TMEM165/GDT1 family protein [Candidatus Omnitrophota bacterium]
MDWRIFITAFVTIFLAELGDKTQLANLSLSVRSGSWMSVFLGSLTAFAAVTLITVCSGAALSRYIRPEYIKYAAASLFVIVGLLMFSGRI